MPTAGGRVCRKAGLASGRLKRRIGIAGCTIAGVSNIRTVWISSLSAQGWCSHEWQLHGSAATSQNPMSASRWWSWCNAAWPHGNIVANSATTTKMCFKNFIAYLSETRPFLKRAASYTISSSVILVARASRRGRVLTARGQYAKTSASRSVTFRLSRSSNWGFSWQFTPGTSSTHPIQ